MKVREEELDIMNPGPVTRVSPWKNLIASQVGRPLAITLYGVLSYQTVVL